jgi:hypothetical protein
LDYLGKNNIGSLGIEVLVHSDITKLKTLSNNVSESIQPIQAMSLLTVNWPSWTQISFRTANLRFSVDVCRIVYKRFNS